MLIAMVAGSLLALASDGKAHGVQLVGSLPGRLPPLSHPDLSVHALRLLAPGALAVALLGLTEAVSIARSVAARSHQRIDSNQEFVGQGLSNLVGSFFSSYASSGSFTRTGVNYSAGAQTPLAAVLAAVFLGAVLLLVAPLTAYLPIPAMAGILVLVAASLIDTRHIGHILRASRAETAVLGVTFFATLFVQLEFAIYVGVILSLVLYLNRTAHPTFVTMVPDPESRRRSLVNVARKPLPECPQLKIVRIDGSIFFGAVDHVAERLDATVRAHPLQAHILIVASGINFIDLAGCEMLNQEARRLRVNGRMLYLCSLHGEAREIMHRGGCIRSVGEQNVFASKVAALAGIVPRLDPERCRPCRLRIFRECAQMPGPPDFPPTTAV
jgi:SulP family sulfate permease